LIIHRIPENDTEPTPAPPAKVKQTRVNWSEGNAKLRLGAAIEEWVRNPEMMTASGEKTSQNMFAKSKNIPKTTFSD
jgi:hypothetical protein